MNDVVPCSVGQILLESAMHKHAVGNSCMWLSDVDNRYDEMRAVRAAQSDPNFRWCTSPTCKSGQIVSNGGITQPLPLHIPIMRLPVQICLPRILSTLLTDRCQFLLHLLSLQIQVLLQLSHSISPGDDVCTLPGAYLSI